MLGAWASARLEEAKLPPLPLPRRTPAASAPLVLLRTMVRSLAFILNIKLILFTEESDNFARSKFGTQKGISSDEYFGRGNFDSNAQSEAKNRLQGFEGATSISSNAYFGRPEDEDPADDYGDLEGAAKDFVRKFGITAGDDLENLSNIVGEGATKLQGAIRAYLGS